MNLGRKDRWQQNKRFYGGNQYHCTLAGFACIESIGDATEVLTSTTVDCSIFLPTIFATRMEPGLMLIHTGDTNDMVAVGEDDDSRLPLYVNGVCVY